jgi:hypothetical protein
MIRIDITTINTRGRKIKSQEYEYIELFDSHIVYAGKNFGTEFPYVDELEQLNDEEDWKGSTKKGIDRLRCWFRKYDRENFFKVGYHFDAEDKSWVVK